MLFSSLRMWSHIASGAQRQLSVTTLDVQLLASAWCLSCLFITCLKGKAPGSFVHLQVGLADGLKTRGECRCRCSIWQEPSFTPKYLTDSCLSIHLRECHIHFLEMYPVVLKVDSLFPRPVCFVLTAVEDPHSLPI